MEVFIEFPNGLDRFEYLIQSLRSKDEFSTKCGEVHCSFKMDDQDTFPTTNPKARSSQNSLI